MKKIITIIILTGIMATMGISQPTASITIENPRIEGNKFYWDVYFMRTNDDATWNNFGNHMLGDCSWYWNFNLIDLTNYAIVEESPIVFGTSYTNSIGVINGNLRIDTEFSPVDPTDIELNVWYKAFTCSADITGDDSQLSGLSWDMVNTGLTTFTNQSVTETDYDSDCDIALNTNCWTGLASSDWDNTGNWSSGAIPTTEDIIYPYNAAAELTGFSGGSGDATVGNLRVNHLAEMYVAPNTSLVINGNINLKGGPKNIIVDTDDTFVEGTLSSAFIPEGTINYNGYTLESGHIEVHRTLYYENTSTQYYHHQVAAPVAGAELGDWDMIHTNSYAYEFQADQSWFNIYQPSRSTPLGYGFILSLYDINFLTTEDVVFYDGVLTTDYVGQVNVTAGIGNYTLVGNPYTAPIDWELVYANNPDLTATVQIWDPANQNYVYHTSGTGGTSNSAQFVQPGQAFFVENDGSATGIDFYKSDRVTTIENYLKNANPNLLRIYTKGGNGTADITAIRFKDADITGGYERNHDALDWPSSLGDEATELWTVGTDNLHFGVDARPLSPELMSVPLSFKAGVAGEYIIGVEDESVQSFSPATEIFLEDTRMPGQAWIDLREYPEYTFDATPEDEYSRFIIHFHIKDFGIDELTEMPVSIFSERTDAIIKNNTGQRINEIQVYDIAGNLMDVKAGVSQEITRMFVSSNTGYYVIKVITDQAVYSEKVLISK